MPVFEQFWGSRDCNEKNDPSILIRGAFDIDFSQNMH